MHLLQTTLPYAQTAPRSPICLNSRTPNLATAPQPAPLPHHRPTRRAARPPTMASVATAMARAGPDVLAAASALWDLDANRLTPGVDYELDVQDRNRRFESDAASRPLFARVDDAVWTRPTFATFRSLLDNYTAQTGVQETVSAAQRDEQRAFLAEACKTPCMQFAFQWLVENSTMRVTSMSQFQEMLADIWFKLYRRDGHQDSSGFEHVFCGEVDEGQVKGMHNFVQIYIEEQRGNFNYTGYLPLRSPGSPSGPPPPAQQLLTIRFDWNNVTKPASSILVGVSPEFELALYTMLFIAGERENIVNLGPYKVCLKVYQMAGKMGTAYPELLAVSEEGLGAAASVAPLSHASAPFNHPQQTTAQAPVHENADGNAQGGNQVDVNKIIKFLKMLGRLAKKLGLF